MLPLSPSPARLPRGQQVSLGPFQQEVLGLKSPTRHPHVAGTIRPWALAGAGQTRDLGPVCGEKPLQGGVEPRGGDVQAPITPSLGR